VNDVDRWVNEDGPEPPGIRELMDAARAVRPMSPERAARLERAFLKAVAARRRRQVLAQTARFGLGGLAAVGAAAMVMLALRGPAGPASPPLDEVAKAPVPTATGVATTGATTEPTGAEPASPDAGADAGAPHPGPRRLRPPNPR
jgi:hypothetical protein